MKNILPRLKGYLFLTLAFIRNRYRWFRAQKRWKQIIMVLVLAALLIGGFIFLNHTKTEDSATALRAVTLKSVAELAGNGTGGTIFGTVRSVSEASILAQSNGTVERVHTTLGAYVGAGSIIAELENDTQEASVLQAEGIYDAAIAARNSVSVSTTNTSGRDAYRSAYSDVDITLETYVDTFFGAYGATGPKLLITADGDETKELSQMRDDINMRMRTWSANLATADNRDPGALISEAENNTRLVSDLLVRLARAAGKTNAGTTSAQSTALASARGRIDATLASIVAAKAGYQSGSVGATAGVDASVKQALGSLRLAQASLEKTRVRAPISGTVNFLPIRVGDYLSLGTHAATVAQNGALEIVAYVSEETSTALSVGTAVTIEETHPGVITAVAPALDPVTKQIEVRIAPSAQISKETLINGQSVHIALPGSVSTVKTTAGLSLPLTAIKIRANDRVVFSVDTEGRLAAHTITTGLVRGDRIEITSELAPDLRIVTDARGLAEGERVSLLP